MTQTHDFKVGDSVRVLSHAWDSRYDLVGTLTEILPQEDFMFTHQVEFEDSPDVVYLFKASELAPATTNPELKHRPEFPFAIDSGDNDIAPFTAAELSYVEDVLDDPIQGGDIVILKPSVLEGVVTLDHLGEPLEVVNVIVYAGERVLNVHSGGGDGWETWIPEGWVDRYVEPEPTLRSELQKIVDRLNEISDESDNEFSNYWRGRGNACTEVAVWCRDLLERFAE